jgi:hypothetical protein
MDIRQSMNSREFREDRRRQSIGSSILQAIPEIKLKLLMLNSDASER